jgi:hypothetical protein
MRKGNDLGRTLGNILSLQSTRLRKEQTQTDTDTDRMIIHLSWGLFFFLFGPLMDRMMSTYLARKIFTKSAGSNASDFWKHPHRNKALPGIWVAVSSIKLMHKIDHHRRVSASHRLVGITIWKPEMERHC